MNRKVGPASRRPGHIESTAKVPTIAKFPTGKFSTKELAALLNVTYTDAYIFIKNALKAKIIKDAGEERRAAKGKTTKVFETITN